MSPELRASAGDKGTGGSAERTGRDERDLKGQAEPTEESGNSAGQSRARRAPIGTTKRCLRTRPEPQPQPHPEPGSPGAGGMHGVGGSPSRTAGPPCPRDAATRAKGWLGAGTLIMEYSEAAKFFLNSFLMFSRSTSLLETRTRMRVWSSVPAPFTKGKERGALSQPVGRAPDSPGCGRVGEARAEPHPEVRHLKKDGTGRADGGQGPGVHLPSSRSRASLPGRPGCCGRTSLRREDTPVRRRPAPQGPGPRDGEGTWRSRPCLRAA